MSVYSGFATRLQQSKYNNLLETLVIALKKRVTKFYQNAECDQQKFKLLIKKIYKKMFLLEKGKFLAPKFTSCFGDLIQLLKIQINYESLSDASSVVSQNFTIGFGDQNRVSKQKRRRDQKDPFMRSRSILLNKKNQLEQSGKHSSNSVQNTLINPKKIKFKEVENQEKTLESIEQNLNTEKLRLKAAARLKLKQLKQLKDLRGTVHMPKLQDYLPKPNQMHPSFFDSPIKLDSIVEQKSNKQKKGFRRQKFSRLDMEIQDI